MNANSYLPGKDGELVNWLENFNSVALDNQNTLPLTVAEINASFDATTDFQSSLATIVAAHAAAKAATMSKDNARKLSVAKVRALVKKIQADPNVPDTLKAQLQITVGSGSHKPIPLYPPASAVATIQAGGIVSLTWDVNGNAPGAIYIIESYTGQVANWQMVNAQTASRFLDAGASIGAGTYYRVKAQRNTRVSTYSNIAVVSAG